MEWKVTILAKLTWPMVRWVRSTLFGRSPRHLVADAKAGYWQIQQILLKFFNLPKSMVIDQSWASLSLRTGLRFLQSTETAWKLWTWRVAAAWNVLFMKSFSTFVDLNMSYLVRIRYMLIGCYVRLTASRGNDVAMDWRSEDATMVENICQIWTQVCPLQFVILRSVPYSFIPTSKVQRYLSHDGATRRSLVCTAKVSLDICNLTETFYEHSSMRACGKRWPFSL